MKYHLWISVLFLIATKSPGNPNGGDFLRSFTDRAASLKEELQQELELHSSIRNTDARTTNSSMLGQLCQMLWSIWQGEGTSGGKTQGDSVLQKRSRYEIENQLRLLNRAEQEYASLGSLSLSKVDIDASVSVSRITVQDVAKPSFDMAPLHLIESKLGLRSDNVGEVQLVVVLPPDMKQRGDFRSELMPFVLTFNVILGDTGEAGDTLKFRFTGVKNTEMANAVVERLFDLSFPEDVLNNAIPTLKDDETGRSVEYHYQVEWKKGQHLLLRPHYGRIQEKLLPYCFYLEFWKVTEKYTKCGSRFCRLTDEESKLGQSEWNIGTFLKNQKQLDCGLCAEVISEFFRKISVFGRVMTNKIF